MPSRQIVLMKAQTAPGDAALAPLGTRQEVIAALARFNTAPDGSPPRAAGTEVLWGPGITVEIPTGLDPVSQAIVTMHDDDIAWPILQRLCKALGWRMVDLETGRSFG